MGRSTDKETRLSEQRKYRSWRAQQKLEIVLAGMRGDRSVKEVDGCPVSPVGWALPT
jgi:hypothetical protein